ncbi:Tetratricopeptide repeat-containing protein [Actinomadura mexicana]|uniref:Tetratricopeptide repeat-containing protein n=1 Tax=Actinomadura mexicana TaxID=134959 RepID=A0A238Z7L5_9ACTN|nr:Tetratricopeptide repeat-containing protein [Actinomadura mexicana]
MAFQGAVADVLLVQRATREALATQPDWGPELFTALAGTGQAAAARNAYAALCATALHHLGSDHLDTLDIRGNLANWQGWAGDVAGAVTASKELVADQLRVLGPDHPNTLITRKNLAQWLQRAGLGASPGSDGGVSETLDNGAVDARPETPRTDHPEIEG